MKVRWLAPLAAFVVLGCGGKAEPAPAARTAVVPVGGVEKPAAPAPPEIKPKPEEPAKPEPVAKLEPVAEPKKDEPVAEPKKDEPVAEPKKDEPVAKSDGTSAQALAPDLMVTDAAVTDEVVDRMPSERKTAWKIGEDAKLIGWFEFKNPAAPVDLELVWKKNGVESWRFPTNVGSGKNWRTWAEKRITKKDAGNWSVEVVDANGHVYESVTYTVE